MGQKPCKHSKHKRPLPAVPTDYDTPPEPKYPSRIIFKALFDFDAKKENDLTFKKDALLAVTERRYNEGSNWIEAVHVQDKTVGYIPRNYIKKDNGTTIQLEIQENVIHHARNGRSVNDPLPQTKTEDLHTVIRQPARLGKRVKALYDFGGTCDGDLKFKKGDIIEVDPQEFEEAEWLFARNLNLKKTGYVPRNYVEEYHDIQDGDVPEDREWFFDVTKSESQRLLMLPMNHKGTYLIRTTSDGLNYALLILSENDQKEKCIKKYLIKNRVNECVYISTEKKFRDIPQLIQYYSANDLDGKGTKLVALCPKIKESIRSGPVEISREKITDLEKLASGYFGDVYKGKLNKFLDVAVKTLRPNRMSPECFLKEADMLSKMNHRRIVTLYNICKVGESIWIVTEFMKNGSLLNFLRSQKAQDWTLQDLLNTGSQIAEGMVHLDSLGIIHRDLRADNVLVGDNYEVKIADFGLAREGANQMDPSDKFSIKWAAPESLLDGNFSTKSDVWSFGVLLYELITYGQVPYPGERNQSVIQLVKAGGKMTKPSQCPEPFFDQVMNPCWNFNPDDRPTFEHLFYILDTYCISTENQCPESV